MDSVKYIQREKTRYFNNEFENMPSLDFSTCNAEELTRKNTDRVDWDKVKEICDKYGFKYTLINSTFGGDNSYFLVYFKTDISIETYNTLRKNYNNSNEDWEKFRNLGKRHESMFLKLHECVHELDENTDLMFEYCWVGNCGLFGSDDVKKMSYSGGSGLVSWSYILDRWSPLIHDTNYKLKKGIYVMMTTRYLKPNKEDSPKYEEMKDKLLSLTKSLLSEEFTAKYEKGKRGCDSAEYEALVVRYKENNEYCCMLRFSRDWLGRYFITHARPLCGEGSFKMNWDNPTEDIKYALGSCAA